jgi:DNA-binding response OmpR family regulator
MMDDEMRVLLVDDEEELVSTLAERLKIRGVAAKAVTSGAAALEVMAQESFDVVLLDVKMPGLSGIEVMKQIRVRSRTVQVILITGHMSAEEGAEGMNAGAYDYVMKPININDLLQKLRAAAQVARTVGDRPSVAEGKR